MTAYRRHGFTLIEVLIAITLLSIMMVLLFSSLKIAAESWNVGETKIAEVNTKAVVYQFFKRHLTTIRPLPMLDEQQNDQPENQQAFQGLPQSMRFVAGLPTASARKGLQLFTIALDPTHTSTLLVSLTPYRETDPDTVSEPVKPEILLDHIATLKFAYFGKTEDVDELQWRDEWRIADRLPSLIKVSIQLEDGSYWPDMVFPLKITQSVSPESIDEDDSPDITDADANMQ